MATSVLSSRHFSYHLLDQSTNKSTCTCSVSVSFGILIFDVLLQACLGISSAHDPKAACAVTLIRGPLLQQALQSELASSTAEVAQLRRQVKVAEAQVDTLTSEKSELRRRLSEWQEEMARLDAVVSFGAYERALAALWDVKPLLSCSAQPSSSSSCCFLRSWGA